MRRVLCPYCGALCRIVPRFFGAPYCAKCGWKVQRAKAACKHLAFSMPAVGLVWFLCFVAAIMRWPSEQDAWFKAFVACIYLVAAVGMTIAGLLSWLRYREIAQGESRITSVDARKWTFLAEQEFQPFLALTTPRAVRISWKGWTRIAFGLSCMGSALLLAFLYRMAVPASTLLLIAAVANANVIRQGWSHRRLFASGRPALGRVLQQRYQGIWIGSGFVSLGSAIRYEFSDSEILLVRMDAHDYSRSLFQDMPVLVFYDPQNPARSIGLGCSLYELRHPD